MPKTTSKTDTVRIDVPGGTLPVLEADVLDPVAALTDSNPHLSAGHFAEGAWTHLYPQIDGAELRFNLDDYSHLTAAFWLTRRIRDLLGQARHARPEGVVEKASVLERIADELDVVLRGAGVEMDQ